MNKMLLGLTAVFALSVAVPAYANEDKGADKKEEKAPAKKGKKKEKEEKKAE